MQYKVTYLLGDQVREAVMTQKELDECRSRCGVIEAVIVSDQESSATDFNSEGPENDGWTEFSYGDKRWSFDSDQLALWDEQLQGFDFFGYHMLVKPTIESVTDFIKRHGH